MEWASDFKRKGKSNQQRKLTWWQHRVNVIKSRIRDWLGINKIDAKLHDTRKILFDLQEQVEDKKWHKLRCKAKIVFKEEK